MLFRMFMANFNYFSKKTINSITELLYFFFIYTYIFNKSINIYL